MPGSTKGSTPSPRRARCEQDYPRTYATNVTFFGDFVPWVFRDVWLERGKRSGTGCPGYRRAAKSDVLADAAYRFNPVVRTLHHLQQDRAVAEHAGTPARLGDAATHSPDVLFALAVQASEAGGLLRRRQRSRRYQPRLVLRPGVSQSRTCSTTAFRISRASRRTTGSGRPSSSADTAKRCFPVDVLVTFKDGKQIREHWDGRDRWNRYTYTGDIAGRFGAGRSRARAAARRQLHEQLEDRWRRRADRRPRNGR